MVVVGMWAGNTAHDLRSEAAGEGHGVPDTTLSGEPVGQMEQTKRVREMDAVNGRGVSRVLECTLGDDSLCSTRYSAEWTTTEMTTAVELAGDSGRR